ncbi:MAG: hypothetical protein LBJ25_03060 [Candidatus Margulisbacteria bacterium]|jgi:hypothetical protein|nr:hypothetical protein [Candidatus Margulisiibacteriota bacterium]
MANDYTDNFAGEPYFISKGEQLSAAGMTAALNTREKVANKTDTLSNSSTEYPSAKAVYNSLNEKDSGVDSQSFSVGTNNLPEHTHTVNDPGHIHAYTDAGGGGNFEAQQSYHGSGERRYMVDNTGKSFTDITVTGGGSASPAPLTINIVPSYYTVIYVMKVS